MPSEVILDASIAAKWHLRDEAFLDQADSLRLAITEERFLLVVPTVWPYEVVSIFSKAVANRRLDEEAARLAAQAALVIPREEVFPAEPMDAFALARRFNRSIFDCFYLAIAEERGCDFWTDDRKLARALSPAYPFVRWIGDFPGAPTPH